MEKFIIAMMVFCLPFYASATEYFVSSSKGNDNNDGLTENTAWKTLNKVQLEKKAFKSGDIISLKRGDIWAEELYLDISGEYNNPIVFASYGTGARPIITVVEEQYLTWDKFGNNIWRTTNYNPKRLKVDGVEILGEFYQYNNLGTKVPDLVQWYYDDNGDGNNYIYIYSLTDPNARSIEFASKGRALYLVLSSYLKFENIEFQGGYYETISVYGCENITFTNVKIGVMSNNGLNIYKYSSGGNSFIQSKKIIIDNCIFDTEFTLNYSNAGTYEGASVRGTADGIKITSCSNSEIRNSTFENWGHSSMSLTTDDDTDEISGFKIYKNYSTATNIPYGGGLAFDGVNTHNNEMFENHFYKTKDSQINGSNNHVHHNVFEELKNSSIHKYPSGRAISLQSYYEGSYNNIIENNLMLKCDGPGVFIAGGSIEFVTGNIIRNNIIYECGSDYHSIGLEIYNSGSTNPRNYNIFQNNLIYSSSRTDPIYYYNDYITSTVFNSKDGDTYGNKINNNIEGNVSPLFESSINNWHLQKKSPAINTGITPLSTKDYDGNPIPNDGTNPDIGIYEFYENTTGAINANAGLDQNICLGESVTLTASGGSSYSWNTGATTKSITVNPTETTNYTVTVTEGSASDNDAVTVAVSSVTVGAGANQTITSGESVTLTASGGDSYVLSTFATTQSIIVSPTATVTYSVTAKKGECEDTDTVTVTVNQENDTTTVTASAGLDQAICLGETVTLTASGGSSYKWSTGAISKSITVNPNETTTYTVTVSEGSASDSDTVTVVVSSITANAGTDKTIYEGESVTLTASGGDSYLWSNGSRTKSIVVSPQETQSYTLTAYKGSCEDMDTVLVTINKKDTSPPPAKANAGEDQTICLGDHIKLIASGGKTYVWSTGATTKSITVNPTRTTSYTVTATRGGVINSDAVVVTVENCSAISDSEQQEELSIYPNPTSGILNISVKNVNKEFSLFVSDAKGSIVYREEATSKSDDFYKKIDLSDFDKGVYFVGLNGTNINEVKKLLVVDK